MLKEFLIKTYQFGNYDHNTYLICYGVANSKEGMVS